MSQLVRRTAIAAAGLATVAGFIAPAADAGRDLIGAVRSQAGVPAVQAPKLPVPVPALPQVAAPPAPRVPVPAPPRTLPRVAASIPVGGEVFQTGSRVAYAPRAGYATGPGTSAAAGSGASGSTSPARRPAEAKAARVLRSRVARLGPCFATLPPLERRFIALRAGMRGSPLSLAEAAQAVHLPLARARRLETRARGEIAALLRDGCETAPRPAGEAWAEPGLSSVTTALPATAPVAVLTGGPPASTPAVTARPQQGVKGAEASSESPSRPAPASTVPPSVGASLASAQLAGGDSSLAAAILAAAALALIAATTLLLRARRTTQPAAAAPVPEQSAPGPSSPLFINQAAAELIERHRARQRDAGEDG